MTRADEVLGHGVAIGVQGGVADDVDDALEALVERWRARRQGPQFGFFEQVRRLWRAAEGALGLSVRDRDAPGERLCIEVVQIIEGAPGEEVALDVIEGALDAGAAIGVAEGVGGEGEAVGAGEGDHLRGDGGVGAGAGGDDDARVVDDAARAGAVVEGERVGEERLGLEAGEARVVGDEQPAAEREHQCGALQGAPRTGHAHAVRGGVVLHLLAGSEVVLAGAPARGAQPGFAHPARQGAVGHLDVVFGAERLVNAHHVAGAAGERCAQRLEGVGITRRRLARAARRRGAPDAAHGVARQP